MKVYTRLAGALCVAMILGTGAFAGDKPCAGANIDGTQAKDIAADYLDELGYNEHAPDSTWHFTLRDSSCVNGQWRVSVDLGPHASIKKKRMVLINCQTGEVEDHFAEGDEVAGT